MNSRYGDFTSNKRSYFLLPLSLIYIAPLMDLFEALAKQRRLSSPKQKRVMSTPDIMSAHGVPLSMVGKNGQHLHQT
jgi:hypothetical protein